MKQTVFITGSSRGIGKAVGEKYEREGFLTLGPPRTELDLSSIESVQEFTRRHQHLEIDVLINNAGINEISTISNISLDIWQKIQRVNVESALLLIQFFSRNMIKNNWGRIVNLSSCYSHVSRPGRGAYASSKAALDAITRTACLEFAENNILVNSVSPGFVLTELTRKNNSSEQIEKIRQSIPLGRLASPDEVANLVYFLGSNQNSYITGQTIILDGGFLCQ